MAYTNRGSSSQLRNSRNSASINVSANTGSGAKGFSPGYPFRAASEIAAQEYIVESEMGASTNGQPMLIQSFSGQGSKGLATSMEKGQFLGICNTGAATLEVFLQVQSYKTVAVGAVTAASGDFLSDPYISILMEPGKFLSLPNIRMLIFQTEGADAQPHSAAIGTQVTTGIIGDTDGNGFLESTDYFSTESAGSHAVTNGITPGSISINFYSAAYQEFGITNKTWAGKRQTPSSDTGLAANTAHRFKITADGGSAVNIVFTTDTSDTTWGNGVTGNGVLKKINDAFFTAYKAGTLVHLPKIGIVDGDIRVTSGSRKSTSAIALADSTTGSETQMFGTGGIITHEGQIDAAVAAALETPLALDRKSDSLAHLMIDKGNGTGSRADGGSFNMIAASSATAPYAPSNITMQVRNAPPYASFVMTYSHNAAHSGLPLTSDAAGNCIKNIFARSVNPNVYSRVKIFTVN